MTKKLADLKLSIPPDAIDFDRVLAFYVRAFVVDAEEVVSVESDNQHADGFGVYAELSGETMHVADRRNRQDAEALCADLNIILDEHKTLTRKEA